MHYLVAAYLQIERPDEASADDDGEIQDANLEAMTALGGGIGRLQTPVHTRDAIAAAQTELDVLSALEHFHFGGIKNVRDL